MPGGHHHHHHHHHRHHRSHSSIPVPVEMPSPSIFFPSHEDITRAPSSYPSPRSLHPTGQHESGITGFLTVPGPFPVIPHAHSDTRENRHHRHHHHHRTHSNPPPVTFTHSSPVYVTHSHHGSYTQLPGPAVPHVHNVSLALPERPVHPPFHPHFQYSRCTGRKKALCVGINYYGQQNQLRGCVNDAKRIMRFLIGQWGYNPGDIVLLTDDSPNPRQQPTRKNIIEAMHWLVQGANPHDSLVFHYSGHGGQTKDLDGDEIDGYDEVIYPVDYRNRGHIVDDEMHDIMVKTLPSGCRLTAIFDCCHSGSALDLPFIYGAHGRLRGSQINRRALARKATPADVISWSACKDGQTSADTFHNGEAVGAMSYAFIKSLTSKPHQSYQELLHSIRMILQPKYNQKPQLGSSHHINTSLLFVM